MHNHLNLIKTDYQEVEKRIFPRFPFSYLTFRCDKTARAFEVKDISHTGMQIALRDGGFGHIPGGDIVGELHWKGRDLEVRGTVKWVKGQRLGLAFKQDARFSGEIKEFLSVENLVTCLRPVHALNHGPELPTGLKYWLQADGPVEIFVWRYSDGEISRFQCILLDAFIEWEDGKGLKTGKVLTKRDLDTPLICEDEFLVQMDASISASHLDFARRIVQPISHEILPNDARDFLLLKLGQ